MSRADFALDPAIQQKMRAVLAADGVLRVGLNMANFLLVSGTDDHNNPAGLSPDLAQKIAEYLDVPCALVPFKAPVSWPMLLIRMSGIWSILRLNPKEQKP